MEKPQIITHANQSVPFTVYDVKWVPNSAKFVSVGSSPRDAGILRVWELYHGAVKPVAEV